MAVSFSFSNSCLAWLHGSACTKIWRLRGFMSYGRMDGRFQDPELLRLFWTLTNFVDGFDRRWWILPEIPCLLSFSVLRIRKFGGQPPQETSREAGLTDGFVCVRRLKQEMHQLLSHRSCYWRPEIGTRCDQRHFPLHHLRPVNAQKALLLSIIVVV